MSKRKRIEALEQEVAELKARLIEKHDDPFIHMKGYVWATDTYHIWQKPAPIGVN